MGQDPINLRIDDFVGVRPEMWSQFRSQSEARQAQSGLALSAQHMDDGLDTLRAAMAVEGVDVLHDFHRRTRRTPPLLTIRLDHRRSRI